MTTQNLPLSLKNISKSFAATRALVDVSFDLAAGEVHCLVGENGAGKSTLIKLLSGAERPDVGEIELFGKRYAHLEPSEAMRQGISTIYQDPDLVSSLTVADNIFLNSEKARYGFVNARLQLEQTLDITKNLGFHLEPQTLVENLSPAQKQVLQIVRALHRKAKIIIMDEPTSSLGQEEAVVLLELVKRLAEQGYSIIYISHFLDEVFEIADRITVLKDGRKVGTYAKNETISDEIVRAMVGREAALFYKKEKVTLGDVALKVRGYRRGSSVKDVSFDVRKGEILGLGGMVGSGRTELVRLLFGADKKEAGELFLGDKNITPKTPREAIARGLCMLTEDRQGEGLFSSRPVKENIAVTWNEGRGLGLKGEVQIVEEMVAKLHVSLANIRQEVKSLSGGNQQKSILARWLLSDAAVFMFDEPTKGVDIGAKEDIYKLMTELAKQGKMIIMVSSDMPELLSMSDRIGIMREGELVKVVEAEGATEESLLRDYLGLQTEKVSS
jgi:ribose transport system ATP-binding protein